MRETSQRHHCKVMAHLVIQANLPLRILGNVQNCEMCVKTLETYEAGEDLIGQDLREDSPRDGSPCLVLPLSCRC